MPDFVPNFLIYLAVMAITTYLVRLIPLLLVRRKIENRFIKSFLYYVPYSVLSVMTFPAVIYSTGNILTAVIGTVVACILAFFGKSLITVAASASVSVLFCEIILALIGA